MKKNIAVAFAVSFFMVLAHAQEVNFSGDLSSTWGTYMAGTENTGDLSIGSIDFIGAVKVSEGNGMAFVEGQFAKDCISNEASWDFSEAYIDYSSSFLGLRIGQQKIVWGKADEIDVTNSVFPKDMTSLFKDDDKLAVKAARFSMSGNLFTVDALMIPVFTGSKLPLDESNPLREYSVPKTIRVGQGNSFLQLPVNVGKPTEPKPSLKDMEWGIKASGYFPAFDVSFYGFYGWDKTPVFDYRMNLSLNPANGIVVPDSLNIDGEYRRLSMVGFDFAVPLGSTVLRMETAFFHDREFQSSAETIMSGNSISTKHDETKSLVGLDWMPDTWTITAQYFFDYAFNKSDEMQRKESFVHGATISVSKTFLGETLEASLSGVVGFNDFDSAVKGSILYSLSDQLKISAGTYVFLPGPEEDGDYGKYKNLSNAYVKVQYKW